jgi:hypothetical protein
MRSIRYFIIVITIDYYIPSPVVVLKTDRKKKDMETKYKIYIGIPIPDFRFCYGVKVASQEGQFFVRPW